MKILHITTHFNIGGISNYILTLSKAMKAAGAEVMVASSGGDLESALAKGGIRHIKVGIKTKFEFNPKVFIWALILARTVRDEKVDIIHAHSRVSQVAGALVAKMTGVPYVTTCHGYFKKRLRGIVDTWGEKVIAISDAVKTHLEADLGVREERIALIYSGVDINRFARDYFPDEIAMMKKALGLKDGPVIGTIGRLSAIKGQKYFIEAMKDIVAKRPDAQALILGSGEEEAALKKMTKSLGIEGSVHFFSSCPDTHQFLSVMDVFVFPSIKEGLGIALLEALASRRPCVASRIGGIENIIDNGSNGLLVPVGDTGAISEEVVRLLEDEPLRKKMGELAKALVRDRFSLDVMAGKVMELYKRVQGPGSRVQT